MCNSISFHKFFVNTDFYILFYEKIEKVHLKSLFYFKKRSVYL